MARGKILYVPPAVVEEMKSIKLELGLNKNVEALQKMTNYSKVGREAEYIKKIAFFQNVRRKK